MHKYAKSPFVIFLDLWLTDVGLRNIDLAARMKMLPNHISMIRNGSAVLPFEKFSDLMVALEITDPTLVASLAQGAMYSYFDHSTWKAFKSVTEQVQAHVKAQAA